MKPYEEFFKFCYNFRFQLATIFAILSIVLADGYIEVSELYLFSIYLFTYLFGNVLNFKSNALFMFIKKVLFFITNIR